MYGRAPVIHDLRIACAIWGSSTRHQRPNWSSCAARTSPVSPTRCITTTSCEHLSTRCPRRRCASLPPRSARPTRRSGGICSDADMVFARHHRRLAVGSLSCSHSLQERASRNARRCPHRPRRRNRPLRRNRPSARTSPAAAGSASACSTAARRAVALRRRRHRGWPEPPVGRRLHPRRVVALHRRAGNVSVVRNGQVTVVGRPADVVAAGEGGMLGIAVDPAFNVNRRIYTCYMTATDVRVVRWTVSDDWTSLGNRATWSRRSHGRAAATPGAARGSGRTGSCGSRRAMPRPVRTRRIRVRSAARCCESRLTVQRQLGTRVVCSTRGSTPTGSATRRASPSGRATARPSSSSTVRDATTRSRPHRRRQRRVEPGARVQRERADDRPERLSRRTAPGLELGVPDDRSVRWHVRDIGAVGSRVGQLAMAVLKDQQLRMVDVASGASAVVLTGQGRLRVAVEGPDGRLYVLVDANPGRILQVTPVV